MFRILGKSLDSWIIYSFLDKEWTKLGVQMEFTCHQLNWAILKGVLYFEVSIIPVQFVVEEITCLRDATSAIKNSKYLPILCNRLMEESKKSKMQGPVTTLKWMSHTRGNSRRRKIKTNLSITTEFFAPHILNLNIRHWTFFSLQLNWSHLVNQGCHYLVF